MATPDPSAPDEGADNRGKRATITPDGNVHGSGSGTGGGGAPEDFDSDSASGAGGDIEPRSPPKPGTGADAPSHGSR